MMRYKIGSAAVALLVAVLLMVMVATADGTVDIQMDAPSTIQAGEPLSLQIVVHPADATQEVQVVILNGLQVLHETLTLGSGGTARWVIPAGTLTKAGTSKIIVQYDDTAYHQSLLIEPLDAAHADLLTASNRITAYGDESTQLMLFVDDKWGNMVASDEAAIHITYPDTSIVSGTFQNMLNVGIYDLISQGNPGRIRIIAESDDAEADIELFQTPGSPSLAELSLTPACVLADGRDTITLTASIFDREHNPVSDGTLVTFYWDNGLGYAQTVDGEATLTLPSPPQAGNVKYYAQSGNTQSDFVELLVATETCLQ